MTGDWGIVYLRTVNSNCNAAKIILYPLISSPLEFELAWHIVCFHGRSFKPTIEDHISSARDVRVELKR